MSVDLIIHRRNGTVFTALNSPFPTPQDCARTITALVADLRPGEVSEGASSADVEFARHAVSQPLGTVSIHLRTGLGFHIEGARR